IPLVTVWNRVVFQPIAMQAKQNTILTDVFISLREIDVVELVALVKRYLGHRSKYKKNGVMEFTNFFGSGCQYN
ncbi:MAG: hypothetical protein ABL888_12475, partial [Pirellulaceae bacterium]